MAKSEDIVNFVLAQMEKGALGPGDRLPTHRDMAWEMKCSVGTVTRAYAELERRGIAYGQVGRGTYVFGTGQDKQAVGNGMFLPDDAFHRSQPAELVDLSLNRFHHPDLEKSFASALQALSGRIDQADYRSYFDCRGRAEDTYRAARWLEPLIGPVSENNILLTQGAQSGLYLVMSCLAGSGDSIATEAFGYPGIKVAAQEQGLRIAAIDMDDEGMIPKSFEAAAIKGKVRLLVTVPTNHNPTGTSLSLKRRQEIIRIARAHNIMILEDGVYNPLHKKAFPTFRELAPDISLYLTSFSKVFSPSLRVGYIVAPDELVPKLVNRMTAISWMTSAITLDLANFLLEKNVVEAHRTDLAAENERRFIFAKGVLSPWISKSQIDASSPLSHLWLKLPPIIASSDFVTRARQEDILLIGGDRFAMNRQMDDNFVRICLMGVPEFETFKHALFTIRSLLSESETRALIS